MNRVGAILDSIGWGWPAPFSFTDHDNTTYHPPIPRVEEEGLAHALRDALRRREIAITTIDFRRHPNGQKLTPRADFQGLEEGADTGPNRELSMCLPPYEQGVLRLITSGGVLTLERQFRHKRKLVACRRVTDPTCKLCGAAPDTRRHRYWHCANLEELRPEWFRNFRDSGTIIPECVASLGVPRSTGRDHTPETSNK